MFLTLLGKYVQHHLLLSFQLTVLVSSVLKTSLPRAVVTLDINHPIHTWVFRFHFEFFSEWVEKSVLPALSPLGLFPVAVVEVVQAFTWLLQFRSSRVFLIVEYCCQQEEAAAAVLPLALSAQIVRTASVETSVRRKLCSSRIF